MTAPALSPAAQHARKAALPWLLALARVTRPGADPIETETIELYADLLALQFDPTAFTLEALDHVTTGDGRGIFPPIDTIRRRLRDHTAKAQSERLFDHMTDEEIAWVQSLRTMITSRPLVVRQWLDFIENRFPRAFDQILREFGPERLGNIRGLPEPPVTSQMDVPAVVARALAKRPPLARMGAQPPVLTPEQQLRILRGAQ